MALLLLRGYLGCTELNIREVKGASVAVLWSNSSLLLRFMVCLLTCVYLAQCGALKLLLCNKGADGAVLERHDLVLVFLLQRPASGPSAVEKHHDLQCWIEATSHSVCVLNIIILLLLLKEQLHENK